ncbi:GAF and ANTAR domain-containing protein [Jatrophihabitans telluris]|uniref:GAF and ANTAR domain-containing protein n=1 Tax=Jatrophihabitans telluris TaxID=2038343 RepID=A0ABY4QXY5_9ACTN|nr:GAF and ANTAR domain-containing protein [Jatrophihabitans telluris]UQX88444.1 GAF and ANTAR domain-containing protein [Jatrophihabitans telluris]
MSDLEPVRTDRLVQVSRDFTELARELASHPSVEETLAAIVTHAVATIDGTEDAAVTLQVEGGFRTIAATGDLPLQVDKLQYETGEGPCVHSIEYGHVLRSNDLATDPRWPLFGPRASRETSVVSMLSHRLFLEDEPSNAALNLYSRQPSAFADYDLDVLDRLATHCAIALSKARAQDASHILRASLDNNRRIGTAVGILMAVHKITSDEAFDLLRLASQHHRRRLVDVANEVYEQGKLDL